MKGRAAFLVSAFLVLSTLGQGLASPSGAPAPELLEPKGPVTGLVYISGDWTVAGHETYMNATIYLAGNLTVSMTGQLEFINTTLAMNLDLNGRYNVVVDGVFTMADLDSDPQTQYDASRIMSNNPLYKYMFTANPGSTLNFRNSVISDCGYSTTYYGLNVNTANAVFEGMTFKDNYYGITLRNSAIKVRDSVFEGNVYGLQVYFCNPTLTNLTVSGSTSRGMYLYTSKPALSGCSFTNNRVGIYLLSSDAEIVSCSVTGSDAAGIYAWASSPLLVGCTLSNALDMDVRSGSFPRLMDTQIDESRVNIDRGLYVSVGRYVNVSVVSNTGAPQPDITVAILDHHGNPASSGITDGAGMAAGMAFRERMLTRDGPIEMPTHTVMSFALRSPDVLYGENITALQNGSSCLVAVTTNPAGTVIWPSGHTLSGPLNYTGSRIIALGNVNVNSGTLSLNNTELMIYSTVSRTISLASSSTLDMADSQISSIGTTRVLDPIRTTLNTDTSSRVHARDSRLKWTAELLIRNSETTIDNLEVVHASLYGARVVSCSPRIEGLSVDWTPTGIYLSGDNSRVSGLQVQRARTYAVHASQSAAALSGIRINNSARGVYSYFGMLELDDVEMTNCDYGVFGSYTIMGMHSFNISRSSIVGIYAADSSLDISKGTVSSSGTGVHVRNSDILGQSLTLLSNGAGLRATQSAPVLLNSTLSNTIDINSERGSAVSAVNCTMDRLRNRVQPSAHIDLGDWFSVRVMDATLQPVPGCNVSVSDSDERVSGSGVTDHEGMLRDVAFRHTRQHWNLTLFYEDHTVFAFGSGFPGGSVTTPIWSGDTVEVQMPSDGLGWIIWPMHENVMAPSNYSNVTILAHKGVTVDGYASLGLENSTLWFFGGPGSSNTLEVKSGSFNMCNSKLSVLSARAPLQPSDASVIYRAGSEGQLSGSLIYGMMQVTVQTSNLAVDNCIFSEMSGSGLLIQSCSPTVRNTTFHKCANGIWSSSGSPYIRDTRFVECRDSGFYASGGSPYLAHVTSLRNLYGFYFTGVANTVTVSECRAENNDHGYYMNQASPSIIGSAALNNTNSGFYCQNSHPAMESVSAIGNIYGGYLFRSWPTISNSEFSMNSNGIFSYQSAPFITHCTFQGNDMGLNSMGHAATRTVTAFSTGKALEHSTFINGGVREHISVTLPSRAVVTLANMSFRGAEIGGDAIIEDPHRQMYPAMHGDWIVWENYMDGIYNIYAYDLSMDTDGNGVPNYLETPSLENDPALLQITFSQADQMEPDIHGDTIVWTDYRNGNADIYAYSLSNRTEWAVCTHPSTQLKPAVYGDKIVWQDYRNGNYDIYMLNISTGDVSRLSDSQDHDMRPRIHGNHVAWYSYRGSPGSGENSDIYLFDIDSWQLKNINDDKALQYTPDVYGGTVVWHDDRNGDWEIFGYDIALGTITRLANETGIQLFRARIYQDRVVYYSHKRDIGLWGVRMANITTGAMTIIEGDIKGDSCPATYGNRIAWVNRTGNLNDICVLDLGLAGLPSDVRLDINNDGTAEFSQQGAFGFSDYISGPWLAAEFNRNLNRADPGMIEIPISVQANGTGRVVLGTISLAYYIPTYLVNCSMNDSKSIGASCTDSSPMFVNSTFSGNPIDLFMNTAAAPVALNTTFSDSKLQFLDRFSSLTVRNFLHVRVQNLTAHPLDARVSVTDNGQPKHETSTGLGGQVEWLVLTDRVHNSTGRHENSTLVTVSMLENVFADNPRGVNMSVSHWETFTTDSLGPRAIRPYPPPDWTTSETAPGISVIVTDNLGVDPSSIRLYVQSAEVTHASLEVPGGYNISHQPGDFPNGTLVECRIYARDFDGNVLDYSWVFKVDTGAEFIHIELLAGWNFISIPFDTHNASVESVLRSIEGKYDRVLTYSRLGPKDRWLGYRPGWQSSNGFESMDRKAGYWIHVMETCTLELSGVRAEITSIPLYAGWNMVGYPAMAERQASATLPAEANIIAVWKAESPYVEDLNPATVTMSQGCAYWVRVTDDVVWVVYL